MDSRALIGNFKKQFPEFESIIGDVDFENLPYLQVNQIANIVNKAIEDHEDDIVKTIFLFMDSSLQQGDEDVRNIIAVGFLEHLRFNGNEQYLSEMTGNLQKQYELIIEYNRSLQSDVELQDFMKKLIDDSDGLFD